MPKNDDKKEVKEEKILVATTETKKETGTDVDEYNPVTDKKKRKCRDIICLILFTAFWAIVIAIMIYQKVWDNSANTLLLIEPHDTYRRRCGHNASMQMDAQATDYSYVVSSFDQF